MNFKKVGIKKQQQKQSLGAFFADKRVKKRGEADAEGDTDFPWSFGGRHAKRGQYDSGVSGCLEVYDLVIMTTG